MSTQKQVSAKLTRKRETGTVCICVCAGVQRSVECSVHHSGVPDQGQRSAIQAVPGGSVLRRGDGCRHGVLQEHQGPGDVTGCYCGHVIINT